MGSYGLGPMDTLGGGGASLTMIEGSWLWPGGGGIVAITQIASVPPGKKRFKQLFTSDPTILPEVTKEPHLYSAGRDLASGWFYSSCCHAGVAARKNNMVRVASRPQGITKGKTTGNPIQTCPATCPGNQAKDTPL